MSYYFASDIHLGIDYGDPAVIEKRFISWLDFVSRDADGIFLVGDIFDFWYEYKRVIPKGFARVFGKLSELTGRGIPIHFFPGNHDMWIRDYFEKELGLTVHFAGEYMELAGKRLYIDHGDNVGFTPASVTVMNRIFRSKTARKLFSALVHPNLSLKFGQWWSRGSRKKKCIAHAFREENESVVKFARQYLNSGNSVDYFVFGHLHCPAEYKLTETSTLFVLGEWIVAEEPVYGVLSPDGFQLKKFQNNN